MKQKQGFGSSLMSMMTNAAFKLDTLLSQEIKIQESMTILGQEIQNADNFQQLKEILIWFSYRANIQYQGKAISDQGWGCLIRVGQMMLANSLIRETNVFKLREIKTKIIQLFNDNDELSIQAPFSIQQIMEKAQQDFNMKVGDWYTGPKIMCLLEELNNQYENFKHLKIINFVEQCLIEQQLDLQFKRPQLLIIHAIIGDKYLDSQGVHKLQQHLEIAQFAGAIVSKNKKAYFLLGFQKKNALFMDPHYVQDSSKITFESNIKSISFNELCGTIALAYYISSSIEYEHFKYQLNSIDGAIFSIIGKESEFQFY